MSILEMEDRTVETSGDQKLGGKRIVDLHKKMDMLSRKARRLYCNQSRLQI